MPPSQTTDQLTPFGALPRDPSAYEPTDHFRYRFKYRDSPPITAEVIETCIREGDLKTTQTRRVYFFEATVGLDEWRLFVDAKDRAVITAYAPGEHDPDDEEPAPV